MCPGQCVEQSRRAFVVGRNIYKSASWLVSLVPLEQRARFNGDDFCFQFAAGNEASNGESALARIGRLDQFSEGLEG
jgi:hypothetical protein